jgi:hypothetical protein
MVMVHKPKKNASGLHDYRYLVSFKGFKGLAPYFAVRLDLFERAVLTWFYEMRETDFGCKKKSEVPALSEEKTFLERRIAELSDELAKVSCNLPSVVSKIADLEAKKSAVTKRIEEELRQRELPKIEEVQEVAEVLDRLKGDELRAKRIELRQSLMATVRRIDLYDASNEPGGEPGEYEVQLHFQCGEVRTLYFGKHLKGSWQCGDDDDGAEAFILA